jgi:hypothetical protein
LAGADNSGILRHTTSTSSTTGTSCSQLPTASSS